MGGHGHIRGAGRSGARPEASGGVQASKGFLALGCLSTVHRGLSSSRLKIGKHSIGKKLAAVGGKLTACDSLQTSRPAPVNNGSMVRVEHVS